MSIPPRARAAALWADPQFQMAMDDPRTRVEALTAALNDAVEAEREACLAAAEAADYGGPECFLCGCKARAVEAITARRGPA